MDISEIRRLCDDERSYLGFIDRISIFEWIHPRHIGGLDIERLRGFNRFNGQNELSESVPLEQDDDYIEAYLDKALEHREHFRNDPNVVQIPIRDALSAYLYMISEFGSDCTLDAIGRENLLRSDLEDALKCFEHFVSMAKPQHIKERLAQKAYYFFCYVYVSPELATLPEVQKFISEHDISARLEKMPGV